MRFKAAILISILVSLLTFTVSAQTVSAADNTEAKEQKIPRKYYVEVKVWSSAASQGGYHATFDYGRLMPSRLGLTDTEIKQLSKTYNFSSEADALNYAANRGWTLVSTYVTSVGRNAVVHYVMVMETADVGDVVRAIKTNN